MNQNLLNGMNRVLLLSLGLMLTAGGCTVPAPLSDGSTEAGPAAEESAPASPSGGGITLEWFPENRIGDYRDGKLMGYARAPGSNPDWAFENASWQAHANLRIWIDEQVEKARQELNGRVDAVSDREFIMDLRRAVNRLDFSEAEVHTEQFEEGETHFVYLRVEESPARVLEELDQQLESWSSVWQQMKQTEPLRSW